MNGSLFPKLTLLENLRHKFSDEDGKVLEETRFVCIQHLLISTGSLVDVLIKLGVKPNNIFITGKSYSTCSAVEDGLRDRGVFVYEDKGGKRNFNDSMSDRVEEMISHAFNSGENIRNYIVLDEGAHILNLLSRYSGRFVAIEQTTNGIKKINNISCPVISLATSVAKKHFESPFIAQAIIEKTLNSGVSISGKAIGIVGLGSVGSALHKELKKYTSEVYLFDAVVRETSERYVSIAELIRKSAIIYGCTGSDLSDYFSLVNFIEEKTLISCSSEDIEFRSLCGAFQSEEAYLLDDVLAKSGNGVYRIKNGGYPINFDSSPESVPSDMIQLTRALILSSVLQACKMFKDGMTMSSIYSLDACRQRDVILSFLELFSLDEKIEYFGASYELFTDDKYIQHNS